MPVFSFKWLPTHAHCWIKWLAVWLIWSIISLSSKRSWRSLVLVTCSSLTGCFLWLSYKVCFLQSNTIHCRRAPWTLIHCKCKQMYFHLQNHHKAHTEKLLVILKAKLNKLFVNAFITPDYTHLDWESNSEWLFSGRLMHF